MAQRQLGPGTLGLTAILTPDPLMLVHRKRATGGYSLRNWRIEGSLFNGREPDQNRWNIESGKFDSTSIRLSFSPNENWAFQVSHGFLKEPRQLFPGIDTDRTTVSVTYHVKSTDTEWTTTFAWGRNANDPGKTLDAFLLESTFKLRDTYTFFGRAERVEKDELFFGDHSLTGRAFTVNKLALGYIYDFPKWGHLQMGIGVSGSIHFLPSELEDIYTAFPLAASCSCAPRSNNLAFHHCPTQALNGGTNDQHDTTYQECPSDP